MFTKQNNFSWSWCNYRFEGWRHKIIAATIWASRIKETEPHYRWAARSYHQIVPILATTEQEWRHNSCWKLEVNIARTQHCKYNYVPFLSCHLHEVYTQRDKFSNDLHNCTVQTSYRRYSTLLISTCSQYATTTNNCCDKQDGHAFVVDSCFKRWLVHSTFLIF